MATIIIRNLSEETMRRIRLMAAQHGHSMEKEVRHILDRAVHAVHQEMESGLGTFIMEQFQAIGGVELPLPVRSPAP